MSHDPTPPASPAVAAAGGPPPSIAGRSPRQLGGRMSILARQRADHARLDRLMARARETLGPGDEREHARALRALARLVFTHAFAEEAVLFPAARRVLPEGDPLTLRIETDHQEVDDVVADLDGSDRAEPGHVELMEHAFAVLDHDVRTEEDELLPRLQQLLGPWRLRLLGLQWELVRRISPTRPHPVVSRRPPGQTLSALPLTVLDRGRDNLQRLDERTGHRFRTRLATLDRALAAAAGAVEQLPIMQRGERRETSRS
ncbi:hemerythrin domain-containing protein [Pseudonocardia humida]|uniref:Hemerythrin domain-containing protein n=1 Tax=Pseudonocardia humida TaxID=2800819 RepID=A0ABT0ZZW4_9PSEU|nr:hemerythrin domain-containing protein [Pseudonocardia humida]MCO1656256.1 hemerythrin domain-containing protein [Pseudonocardia humida]